MNKKMKFKFVDTHKTEHRVDTGLSIKKCTHS